MFFLLIITQYTSTILISSLANLTTTVVLIIYSLHSSFLVLRLVFNVSLIN
jgi:hypothetical protein